MCRGRAKLPRNISGGRGRGDLWGDGVTSDLALCALWPPHLIPGGEKPGGSAALGGGDPRGEAAMRTRCGGGDPGGRSGRPGGRKEGGRWRGVTRIRPWVGLGDLDNKHY